MEDYFDFFKIPRSFTIDKKALRKKYISNSRAYHPDFFTLEEGAKQEEVLKLSTLNNEGYKTLSDDRKRMQYLLTLNDMFPEEGKAQVPQEFLMEMMDVNEQLMEAQMVEDAGLISQINAELEALKASFQVNAQEAMDMWDKNSKTSTLEEIRDTYLKQQYLRRLQDRLTGVDPEV